VGTFFISEKPSLLKVFEKIKIFNA
jgi:hypothetical protein